MIRDLIKVANKLDYLGLNREADAIDALIRTASGMGDSKEEREKAIRDIIEKSKKDQRYPNAVRTEDENTPDWFKSEIPSGGLQLGGYKLDDEGEWGYEESDEDESISESGEDERSPILGVSPEQDRVNIMRAADMLRNMTEEQFQALKREHPEAMEKLFGTGTLDEVKRANARMINFLMRK
jgi:hypothetical protein